MQEKNKSNINPFLSERNFAFSYLNNRFRCLLFEYYQLFDFKLVNKTKFDHVFIEHHDIHQWISLQLSDDEDTFRQIQYF